MTEVISRLNKALEGRYTIEGELGAGGMATVYLADDIKHERKVAIKVLRPELAAVIGAERFLTEIKTTANLQHPHILPLFDSGVADGFLYYVMPHVEGESLRERLDREKQLPVDEALRITTAVANALDYAHRHEVIHRDIKPENILLHDGEPLVADFGIALAVTAAGGGRLTETGLSLGTPQYMSPEQATADRELSAASDVYALACVTYEMLVGDPPHVGPTVQAVLAKLLTEDPRPARNLRRTIPEHVDAALSRALERLPADRFDSAEAFRNALADPGFTHVVAPAGVTVAGVAGAARVARVAAASRTATPDDTHGGAGLWKALAVAGTMVGIALGMNLSSWLGSEPDPPPATVRFLHEPDSTHAVTTQCCGPPVAFSPQGTRIAYEAVADNQQVIYQRALDELEARPVNGTEGGRNLFFSPDGAWLGFVAQGVMKRVELSGGAPMTVTTVEGSPWGASWGPDGSIVYSSGQSGGLLRVSAGGGEPERVTLADTAAGERHTQPHVLPDGSAILYTAIPEAGAASARIEAILTESGERKEFGPGMAPKYADSGFLIFSLVDGSIMAQPFDLARMDTVGSRFRIAEGVITRSDGTTEVGVSRAGDLAARQGTGASNRLAIVDRNGNSRTLRMVGDLRAPRFSPDGRFIAYEVEGDISGELDDIWIYDREQDNTNRLTFESDNSYPSWSPDGSRVLFDRDAPSIGMLARRADGGGSAELLIETSNAVEGRWSPDGRWLVWTEASGDIWYKDLQNDGDPVLFLDSSFNERAPSISPDGRWIALSSNESGTREVYVRPFPEPGARFKVSTNGGTEPRWSRDGRELFYRTGRTFMSAAVVTGDSFRVVERSRLFEDQFLSAPVSINYDVSPDGNSFVFVEGGRAGQLLMVMNALSQGR